MSQNFAIAVHGGAGEDSKFIQDHKTEYLREIENALNAGYAVLERQRPSVEAVEAAVCYLEDCWLFNAGKGSALTEMGKIEMCASIASGEDQKAGAVAIVRNVKNPISLARLVKEKTSHIYVGGEGAFELAKSFNVKIEPDYYFVTAHMLEAVKKEKNKKHKHGTVGAVACDSKGNVAAATSTGGLENSKDGRIGDSSMFGIGSYADNRTCAVSSTGDGEQLIRRVIAYDISAIIEYKKYSLSEAAHFVIHEKYPEDEASIGVICIDSKAQVAMDFKAERMHRGFRRSDGASYVAIYRE